MPANSLLTFLALVWLTVACQNQGVSTIVPQPRTTGGQDLRVPSYQGRAMNQYYIAIVI